MIAQVFKIDFHYLVFFFIIWFSFSFSFEGVVDEVSHSPTGCWLVTLKDDSGIVIIIVVVIIIIIIIIIIIFYFILLIYLFDQLLAILCDCVFLDERSPLCIKSYNIFVEY